MNRPALVALLVIASCSRAPDDTEHSAAPDRNAAPEANATRRSPATGVPTLLLEGGGLRLATGNPQPLRTLGFGTARAAIMAALAFRGPGESGSSDECGAGPMQFASWPDGLRLAFQDGKFVGWSVDKRGPSTLSTGEGLFVGATRADLEASAEKVKVFESTLGTEFTVGGIGGLLDGPGSAANVTNLWAGTTCMFR